MNTVFLFDLQMILHYSRCIVVLLTIRPIVSIAHAYSKSHSCKVAPQDHLLTLPVAFTFHLGRSAMRLFDGPKREEATS